MSAADPRLAEVPPAVQPVDPNAPWPLWRKEVDRRLDEGADRMRQLQEAQIKNNEMTERIDGNTARLLEIFDAFEGFVKVGGWLGGLMKWVAAVVVAAGILIYVVKTGDVPKK